MAALLFLGILATAARAEDRASLGTTALPEAGRPAYKSLLAGAPLPVHVDAASWNRLRPAVARTCIRELPPARLDAALVAEAARLLHQARIPTLTLARLPRDARIATRIVQRYGDLVPRGVLWLAMLRGLRDALHDPYAAILTPAEAAEATFTSPLYAGVGVVLDLDARGRLQVRDVDPRGPAARSGIVAGDLLLQVGRQPCAGLSVLAASALLRGAVNTPVVATMGRAGEWRVVRMMREPLQRVAVEGRMVDALTGLVRVRSFDPWLPQQTDAVLAALAERGAVRLVVDLRDVPGGSLLSAVDFCARFVPQGTPVATSVSRTAAPVVLATRAPRTCRLPLVVLVDGRTAGAAEVAAACLRDELDVNLLGNPTAGRASEQTLARLPDGSALRYTTARLSTPSGAVLEGVGLKPNVRLAAGENPLDRADELLRALGPRPGTGAQGGG